MAKLDAADRSAIPSSQFGLPEQRKYPMPDRAHAIDAKAYASKEYNEGELSGAQKSKIDRKADAKLGHPRDHSLAMASANHLHRMGHITSAQHKQITSDAQQKLKAAKAQPKTFGAIG